MRLRPTLNESRRPLRIRPHTVFGEQWSSQSASGTVRPRRFGAGSDATTGRLAGLLLITSSLGLSGVWPGEGERPIRSSAFRHPACRWVARGSHGRAGTGQSRNSRLRLGDHAPLGVPITSSVDYEDIQMGEGILDLGQESLMSPDVPGPGAHPPTLLTWESVVEGTGVRRLPGAALDPHATTASEH